MTYLKCHLLVLIILAGGSSYSFGSHRFIAGNDTIPAGTHSDSLTECISSCILSLPYQEISPKEKSHLARMREEELMALEVYEYLYSLYKVPVFNNISRAENVHTLVVREVLRKYGLEDPAAEHATGVYKDSEIQDLYNGLIARGRLSFVDALYVGTTIEDIDIHDLQLCKKDIDNTDVDLVLTNLEKGSRNHMRAFSSHLSRQAREYTPEYISRDYYSEILNSSWEVGNGICEYCRNR